jgi:DNA-binding transcriptional regulator YdaS (Cro superfamily)
MKLREHLIAVKRPDQRIGDVITAFAKRIKKHPKTVRKYFDGTRRPRLEEIPLIERETDGQVTFKDWMHPASKETRRVSPTSSAF